MFCFEGWRKWFVYITPVIAFIEFRYVLSCAIIYALSLFVLAVAALLPHIILCDNGLKHWMLIVMIADKNGKRGWTDNELRFASCRMWQCQLVFIYLDHGKVFEVGKLIRGRAEISFPSLSLESFLISFDVIMTLHAIKRVAKTRKQVAY